MDEYDDIAAIAERHARRMGWAPVPERPKTREQRIADAVVVSAVLVVFAVIVFANLALAS
jgi:hypothetical protein